MRLKTALVLSIFLSFAFVSQSFPNTPINDEHLVTSGETLWSIAELKKPDEVSIWQVMDGIYKANKFLFEKKNPMDISEGTKLIIPNKSFFLEQNGFYVADKLGLDIYQRENMKASINNSKINNIFESTNKVDEIPYFVISDLNQSEVINNIKENYDQTRTLTIESNKNLIEQLNLELKLLQSEVDGKNKIIQSLETENDTQIEQSNSVGWFSYTETKLLLGLLFLLTLLQLMRLFQGKSTETSKADSLLGVDDEFADIDPVEIKMDLAKSLIEDNDFSGAREILFEIISESGADGIEKAEALLKSIDKT